MTSTQALKAAAALFADADRVTDAADVAFAHRRYALHNALHTLAADLRREANQHLTHPEETP